MKIEIASWGIAGIVTGVLTCLIVRAVCGVTDLLGMAIGWGVALANAALASAINRNSVGRKSAQFLGMVVFGILVRTVVVLGAVYYMYASILRDIFADFAIALLVGLFVFMIRENFSLYRFEAKTGRELKEEKATDDAGGN